jgi:hypothetical protein
MEAWITPVTAAKIYALFSLVVICFQFALAAGAPWGSVSMGGKFPGVYPTRMRVAALFMILILSALALVVGVRAGWLYPEYAALGRSFIWPVVVINALGLLMNLATPSRWERILWAPVALVFLVCSTFVGLS